MIEYEKTYLLKYIPDDLKDYDYLEYLDIYIPQNIDHPVLRIRKRGNVYEITKKTPINLKDPSIQHESTVEINKNEFNELESSVLGKRALKHRYIYKYQQYGVEIDVYQGDLLGLIIADIEYDNENALKLAKMPDFCLADVTNEKCTAGGMIVGKSYSDIDKVLKTYGYTPLFM